VRVAHAFPEHQRSNERRDARIDMHNGAAREIQRTHLPDEATDSPYPVAHGVIHKCGPEQGEHDERHEAHALRERADDQRRRDDREHHLEDHERLVRNCGRVIRIGIQADALQAKPVQVPDEALDVRTERQAVAPQDPLNADQTGDHETLHQDRQDVLTADQSAVE
jgi:hypothetical protein